MPSFRGYPACSCLVAWLVAYERELIRRGEIKQSLDVMQLIGNAQASSGVHAKGGAYDIAQRSTVAVQVAREMGAAAWHRTPKQGFAEHHHGVLNGCPHLVPAGRGQITDLARGMNGLVGKHRAADDGPLPRTNLRTWEQGIAWAKAQANTAPEPPQTPKALGVDYSFARPGPTTIKKAGYVAVGRYLSNAPSKNISSTEAKGLHAAGLGVWLVWETTARRAAAGRAAGVSDAEEAAFQANALGVPAECPLFFAVDFDASFAQVSDYLAGAKSVVGERAGVYGGYKITTAARSAGFQFTWQTMAWSAGKVDADANLFQRIKATVPHPVKDTDENVIQHPFPLWSSSPSAPVEVPVSDAKTVHLSDPYLGESSWLALSQKFPGLAYTGNDENGHLCTVDTATGNTVGTFSVKGTLLDPESADVHNEVLWLADLGDNNASRANIVLYVLPEPGKGNKGAVAAERYKVKYSDGPRNAEAFFIHPLTGNRYIISKEASGNLYRNDKGTLDQSTVGTFRLVGRKLPAYVTEAKFTPDGRFVLCRQKGNGSTITVLDGNTFQTLKPFTVPSVKQPESLDTDGQFVFYGSEGANSPLVKYPLPKEYRSAA